MDAPGHRFPKKLWERFDWSTAFPSFDSSHHCARPPRYWGNDPDLNAVLALSRFSFQRDCSSEIRAKLDRQPCFAHSWCQMILKLWVRFHFVQSHFHHPHRELTDYFPENNLYRLFIEYSTSALWRLTSYIDLAKNHPFFLSRPSVNFLILPGKH